MKSNKIIFVLAFILISVFSLCLVASAQEESFFVESTAPFNGQREVSPVDLKLDAKFSMTPDPATLTDANVIVTGDALGCIVAKDDNVVTVYFKNGAVSLGETYTVTFTPGVKSASGIPLEQKEITFTVTPNVPRGRQISNSDMSDIYYNGAFDGDYLGGDFIGGYIYVDSNPVLKYVPAWDGATASQRVYMEPGKIYTARAKVRSDVDQQIGFSITYTVPGEETWYRIAPKTQVSAGAWTYITYTWKIPENADTSNTRLYIASEKKWSTVFIDDWQFYQGNNDFDEPEQDAKDKKTYISTYQDSKVKMLALEILSEELYNSESVTKINLAKTILNFIGFDYNASFAYSSSFEDVAGTDRIAAYVASELGMVDAHSPESFLPDEIINGEQAVKAVMVALGYNNITETSDYMALASGAGLFKDFSCEKDTPITVQDLAKLLDRALELPVIDVKSYGFGKPQSYKKGSDAMSVYQDIEAKSGVIDGTCFTVTDASSALKKDRVSIDGKQYICYADINDYLGCRVEFYFRKSPECDEILYITGIDSMNSISDISTYENTLEFANGRYLCIPDGGKEKTYRLAEEYRVIYNGKYVDNPNDSLMVPLYGSVRLVGRNSVYNLVVIEDIATVIADAVDTTKSIVYSADLNKPLNLSDSEYIRIFDKFGVEKGVESILPGAVLSVMQSMDKTLTTVYVSSEKVLGTVTELSENGNYAEITLTDAEGKSKTYIALNNSQLFENIYIGMNGEFLMDYLGYAVSCNGTENSRKVGYLVDAVVEGKLNPAVKFKIYAESGEMMYLTGAKKIKIDNVNVKEPYAVVEALKNGTAEVLSQLVLYDVDSRGDVCFIDTAYNKLPDCYDYREVYPSNGEDPDGYRVTYSSVLPSKGYNGQLYFYPSSRSFDNKILLSRTPVIFAVPENAKEDDEQKFNIHSNYWDLGSGYPYKVEAYTTNPSSFESDYVVIYISDEYWHVAANAGDKFGFVQDIRKVEINEEIVTKITFANSAFCYTDNSSWLAHAEIGDYICYRTDKEGRLTRPFIVFFDTSHKQMGVGNPYGAVYDTERMMYVNVHSRKGSVLEVVLPDVDMTDSGQVGANAMIVDASRANVYRFNREINKVEKATVNDVLSYEDAGTDCSDVVVITYEGYATSLFITD